jgi:spermidine/putrescine transport system permease protein
MVTPPMPGKRTSEVQLGETLTRRGHLVRSALTSGPGLMWLTLFLLAPLLAIIFISFLTRGVYGEIQWPLTLENHKRLIGFGPLASIHFTRSSFSAAWRSAPSLWRCVC